MTVYIVQAGGQNGPVKIGYAADESVTSRMRSLQTGSAEILTLLRLIPGMAATEAWLHNKFKDNRLRGEWFEFSEDILSVEVPLDIQAASGPKSTKEKAKADGVEDIEVSVFDFHIQRGLEELTVPRDRAAHQAALLRAYRAGATALAIALEASKRLQRLRDANDPGINEAQRQFEDLRDIAICWHEEIRRLDPSMPAFDVPPALTEDAAERVAATATDRGAR